MSIDSDEAGGLPLDPPCPVGAKMPSSARTRGASSIEYALLIALIALVVIAAMGLMGVKVNDLYSSITTGY